MSEKPAVDKIVVALPRPQQPLPPREPGGPSRFASLADLVNEAWKNEQDPPKHAWIRYSLAAGMSLPEFQKNFRELSVIKSAFGRRVVVCAVRMDHHEIELADFDHLTNPLTGQYEIELAWRKKRCDGGSHVFFAVESTELETRMLDSIGRDALDALEALVRLTLGAMIVVQTRQTQHVDLLAGRYQGDTPSILAYGSPELPRRDPLSLAAASDLAAQSANLSADATGRLSLGLRWANIAFKQHDLLAFWTAIEILADCRGHAVYVVVAKAYGMSPKKAQRFAKSLGLDVVCRLRGDLAHDGLPVYMGPEGASYLNALVHDLARHVAGLPCLQFAQRALSGNRVEDWLTRRRRSEDLDTGNGGELAG